jgi:membrane protease YdiL (CAAX protease family)
MDSIQTRLASTAQAMLVGMMLVTLGSLPKTLIFLANFRWLPQVPWLLLPTAIYLWVFWRYLQGAGPPSSTSLTRRMLLRANPVSLRHWAFALMAGVLGIAALTLVLQLVNRMVELPPEQFFDTTMLSPLVVITVIIVGAVVAAVVEEASFRGYMQQPIERSFGLVPAILISGVMFAVAHLGMSLILVPYYVAVTAIYGVITYLTNSILPAVLLHTGANIYSNTFLWLYGHAEWQRSANPGPLIWDQGADLSFWKLLVAAILTLAAALVAYTALERRTRALRGSLVV